MSTEDQVAELFNDLDKRMSSLGLHTESSNVMGQVMKEGLDLDEDEEIDIDEIDISSQIKDGTGRFAISAMYTIGDLAWNERTLDPQKFDEEQEFKKIMPSVKEMTVDSIKDQLLSGNDMFAIDLSAFSDDDDDDEEED